MRRFLALAAFALSACAGIPPCPAEGGPPWIEITTPHFIFQSDMAKDDALEMARRLELTRWTLVEVAWPGARVPEGRLLVVAPARGQGLRAYVGPYVAGWMEVSTRPRIVFAPGFDGFEHFQHELGHYVSHFVFPHQPLWLGEGLAQFVQTMRFDGGYVILGAPSRRTMQAVAVLGLEPVQTLVDGPERPLDYDDARVTARFYATSAMLVHYLANHQRARFAAYLGALARGERGTLAWEAAFPGGVTAAIGRDLGAYSRAARFTLVKTKLPQLTYVPQVRAMADAEVHSLRASLFLGPGFDVQKRERSRGLQRELAALARIDADDVGSLSLRLRLTPPAGRLGLARRATQTHPDAWQAWLELGRLDEAGAEAAFEKARALAPHEPSVLNALAWTWANHGKAKEALPLAAEAALRAPWSPLVLDTYAVALGRTGRCDEARATEWRAINSLPDGPGPLRQEFRARLLSLARECVPAKTMGAAAQPAPAAQSPAAVSAPGASSPR